MRVSSPEPENVEIQSRWTQVRGRLLCVAESLRAALDRPALRKATAVFGIVTVLMCALLTYVYVKYARQIDRQLAAGPFSHTLNVYAEPRALAVGDKASPEAVAEELRKGGYGENANHPAGWYRLGKTRIEIHPGPGSYFTPRAVALHFGDGKISRIETIPGGETHKQYLLEPPLITNISDQNRERRRLVTFSAIPKHLVHAVISAEDKRFFEHAGFDPVRILKAAYIDLREGRKEQGASTLSMQLARNVWLESDKKFRRKLTELLIAIHLESRLSKEEIFEYYSNQIYLGRRGSFNIHGFGEAARAFFGTETADLTLPESALLAGIIQRPSYYNPLRHPERAKERRNLVLRLMHENGYINAAQYAAAAGTPLELAPEDYAVTLVGQHFVDLVNRELESGIERTDRGASVYTSLDLRLQEAAEQAVTKGMAAVDKMLRRARGKDGEQKLAEVALVALDPRTGQIKALVGGRDYTQSQFNRALAYRQPGSVFKPFVFAAALNTAVEGGRVLLTAATTVVDEPTQFLFNRQMYEPANYGQQFYGPVTMRPALAKSMNIATIKMAELAGYDAVVNIARRAGFNDGVQATPALALGSYEATPLEVAAAYTVFANQGKYMKPSLVSSIRAYNGEILYTNTGEGRQALDPRVAYMMTDLLREVIDSGTAASARSRGFRLPAAGKTGTSRDGWFAGYTTELVTVVWVGFDDNTDLKLEGSKSALPIWTDFMKAAHQFREYSDAKRFPRPQGVVLVEIDTTTGQIAGPYCPSTRTEVFISGTAPTAECLSDHLEPPFESETAPLVGVADRPSGVEARNSGNYPPQPPAARVR